MVRNCGLLSLTFQLSIMVTPNPIEETAYYLNQENNHLGYRMLLDLVLDSAQPSLFKACISLSEWKEKNPDNHSGFLQRSQAILQSLEKISTPPSKLNEAIMEAHALCKQYGKQRFALGPVDLHIRSGHLIGLVGENGNGKTTLLRMLANDLSSSSGHIQYHFAKNLDEYSLRSKLIYIPQRTPKWFGNVKDNLKFTAQHYGIPAENNEDWVLMMMIRFGLYAFRNHSWSELSSGYKMRFELARTFLRQPKLLLLDEPLANLDIVSQQLILEDLKMLGKRLRNPLAIVLSSQQLYEVEKVSDEVVFLKQGKPSSFNALKQEQGDASLLVIELEIENSREALQQALAAFQVKQLNYLGSSYYAELQATSMKSLLRAFSEHDIQVRYLRDVTQSTRRFFNA